MVSIQRVALISGAVFVLISLLGFTPVGMGLMQMNGAGSGMLLGIFPVNALHNAVHLLFGVWGLWASRRAQASTTYAIGSGAVYLLLGVLGIFTGTLLGIVPIGGYDVYLHLALAVTLAGFGFRAMFASQQAAAQA